MGATHRIRVLVWFLCTSLLKRNHGFTPANPRFSRIRPSNVKWTVLPPRGVGNSAGSNRGIDKHNNVWRVYGAPNLDDSSSQNGPPVMLGGGIVGLWSNVWPRTGSPASSPSSTRSRASSTAAKLGQQVGNWKALLVVALLMLQTVGLQSLQLCTTVVRQGTAWYLAQLSASPLLTKSVSCGVVGVCGDYMAQWMEHRLRKRKCTIKFWNGIPYDKRRGFAALLDGIFISGPLMHWCYNLFEILVPSGRSLAAIVHVIADCLLLDSIFVATTIVGTGLMEGYALKRDVLPQLQRDYCATLKASWITSVILMPLEYICFRYLPVMLRVLAMNLMDIIWDGVVLFMAHKGRQRNVASAT